MASDDRFNLTFDRIPALLLWHDRDADLMIVHFSTRPEAAMLEEVEDGWFVRIAKDNHKIVGMEWHELQDRMTTDQPRPGPEQLLVVMLNEITDFGSYRFDEDFEIEASTDDLPLTTSILIYLAGQAIERFRLEQTYTEGLQHFAEFWSPNRFRGLGTSPIWLIVAPDRQSDPRIRFASPLGSGLIGTSVLGSEQT